MLYDKNPPYIHYSHLPYSREPWKSLYVFQRLLTTLLLVPLWTIKHLVLPRRFRPRQSWSLWQTIYVKFTRRIYKVTEVAGVTWGTRDPTVAPDEGSLKDTAFVWVEPLAEKFRTGILGPGNNGVIGEEEQERVPYVKVGCYIWPKLKASTLRDLENGQDDNAVKLVGVFMHGGGYCHMSAHEASRTSRIPRNLIKRAILDEVYSVEYRLLQHARFPAVVMDAAAVYAHVVDKYFPLISQKKCKVILIGDSSGGNLVLALARWIRDEGRLSVAEGLLLLSPSSDPSHHLPETLSSYIPRPNEESDYLVDTPEPRALLQRTFLGFKRRHHHRRHDYQLPFNLKQGEVDEMKRLIDIVHSEYVSPCSPVVLQRWGHEAKQDPYGEGERAYMWKTFFGELPRSDSGKFWKKASQWFGGSENNIGSFGEAQMEVAEEGESPRNEERVVFPLAVPKALNPDAARLLESSSSTLPSTWPSRVGSPSLIGSASTSPAATTIPCGSFPTLFSHFPRTHIAIGTAERLTREVASLICAMQKDGVDVDAHWIKDACHDVLMVPPSWWDKSVVEGAWDRVAEWAGVFRD